MLICAIWLMQCMRMRAKCNMLYDMFLHSVRGKGLHEPRQIPMIVNVNERAPYKAGGTPNRVRVLMHDIGAVKPSMHTLHLLCPFLKGEIG